MKKPPKANRRGALGGEVLFLGSICQKLTSPLITHFMGHASKMFALWCFVVILRVIILVCLRVVVSRIMLVHQTKLSANGPTLIFSYFPDFRINLNRNQD